jgi:hypothetical protein
MTDDLSSADLRRWAARCASDADLAKDPADRERLLKMRDALLFLADNLDRQPGETGGKPEA